MKPVELEDCAWRVQRKGSGREPTALPMITTRIFRHQAAASHMIHTKIFRNIQGFIHYYLDILSVTYNSMIKKLHLRQSYPAIPAVSNENLPTDPLPWAWGMNLKRHLEVSLAEKPHRLQNTWNHLNKSVAGQQLNYCSCRCQPQPILPILYYNNFWT